MADRSGQRPIKIRGIEERLSLMKCKTNPNDNCASILSILKRSETSGSSFCEVDKEVDCAVVKDCGVERDFFVFVLTMGVCWPYHVVPQITVDLKSAAEYLKFP